ncbi:MAG: tetratricopeptide repeat protein [Bacteroidetes bacterium]|nr:tetratricopeptide repeat protein [Bacteroidota bacterium]
MENSFTGKTDDFVRWCENAFNHYKNSYYEDALTNMRKSGEAACKLMFIYKYNEKVAAEKIAGKSYKELIQLIIWENLAPRRVINWLESLQIHGNTATHDNRVMQEQAHYSITALRLLIDWMFREFLKIMIPSRLKKAMAEAEGIYSSKDAGKKLQEELSKMKREKEELERNLSSLKEKGGEENEKFQKFSDELQKSISRIKELEEAQHRIKILEEELAKTKREAEDFKQQQTQIIPKKKQRRVFSKKYALLVLLPIAVITVLFFLFKKNFTSSETKETVSLMKSQPDTFKVEILPLSILQDNPNIQIKFEDALESRLKKTIQEHKLPMSVFYNASFTKTSVSSDDAINEGIKNNSSLVVYGEIYEPGVSDSAQVNIKYSMTRKDNRMLDETGVKSFMRLTDSSAIKIMMDVECFIQFAMADNYMSKKKYSDALALLYQVKPISKRQIRDLSQIICECHFALKNYPATIKELEKYIKLDSTEGYPYAFMANVLKASGKLGEAEKYYEKSLLVEPNNVNTLLNYAELLADKNVKNKMYKARQLVQQAIKYDSTNATAWYYLGSWEWQMNNAKSARDYFYKCLKFDSTNIAAKKSLAKILAFDFKEPEKGVELLSSILKKDSTDAAALFILANIYTSTNLKDSHKAEYLFAKSKKYVPNTNDYSNQYGLGMTAQNKGDFKNAEEHYLKAYALDSSDMLLCTYISQVYISLGDDNKALKFLQRAYGIDSMNHYSNLNLGYFYYTNGKLWNNDKAIYYYERVLKTDPYDTLALEGLGMLYFEKGNMNKAKDFFTRRNAIPPSSFTTIKSLGLLEDRDGKYEKALPYYQKAIELSPNDWEANSKLAFVMMKVSTTKYLANAMSYAKKSVELNPQSPDAMYIYSQILILSGDYYKASENYRKAIEINPALKDAGVEQALKQKGL